MKNTNEDFDFAAMIPLQVFNSIESGDKKKLEQIKKIIIGGGEISGALARMISSLKNECYATYGMTETYSHVAVRKLNPVAEESFTLLKGINAWYDERNCLVIDAPKLGVRNLVTNDIVEFTDLKKFKWLGRYDNIINSGGLKIIPEQVEKLIEPSLNRRFFVTGLKDEKLGEKMVLVIEGEPFDKATKKLFWSHMESILEKNEIPKEILFSSKFIETPNGKIRRKETIESSISLG